MRKFLAAALAVALLGGAGPSAEAASLSKREARDFLVHALPRLAPRALLRDERARFFSTEGIRVESAGRCRRHSAASVISLSVNLA